MHKFIIFLLLQCCNFSLFAEAWSSDLLKEFSTLAKDVSERAGQTENRIKVSPKLRQALFTGKGTGRLKIKEFSQLIEGHTMTTISCRTDKEDLIFTLQPFNKLKNFFQACLENGAYVQPTLERELPSSKFAKTVQECRSVHQEESFRQETWQSAAPSLTGNLPPLFNCSFSANHFVVPSSLPKTIGPLQFTLNSAYHIIGDDIIHNPGVVVPTSESNPTIIARECKIIKITFRESTKRNRFGNLIRYYVADHEKCSVSNANLQQIICTENKTYILSFEHIKLLDHNYQAKTVCSPLVPPKHFLPMSDGSFITTSMHDGQWIIHHHKPSGIVVSLPVANLEIIALTAASSNSAAFLTNIGIFLYKTNAQEPTLEYYYSLDERYNDITCKNTDGSRHFFITNMNKQMITEIYQEPTMKRAHRDFHLERNLGALEYDAKNDRLLIADTEFGQIGIFSCELKLIQECPPLSGLVSFSITDDGALFCLSESTP